MSTDLLTASSAVMGGAIAPKNPTQVAAQEPEYYPDESPATNAAFLTFWNRRLPAIIPGVVDLQIGAFVGDGDDGNVFELENRKTKEVSRVLKIAHHNRRFVFNPNEGAHLISGIGHPGICSPTHLFYLIGSDTFSQTPGPESISAAIVMPYLRDTAPFGAKRREIAKRIDCIFHFGLLLTTALYELSRRGISHDDLNEANILVNRNLEPIIIDFDKSKKTATVSCKDYHHLRRHLKVLVRTSDNFKPAAQQFLLNYLKEHCRSTCKGSSQIPSPGLQTLPQRMIILMEVCKGHLSGMQKQAKAQTATPFDKESMERCIQEQEESLRNQREKTVDKKESRKVG